MWLPVTEFIDGEVYFLESDPYYTLTNPANTQSPVVVSYYNGTTNAVSQTSGSGPEFPHSAAACLLKMPAYLLLPHQTVWKSLSAGGMHAAKLDCKIMVGGRVILAVIFHPISQSL